MLSAGQWGALFNIVVMLGLPLGVFLALCLRPSWRYYLPSYLFGALTFLAFQVLLRLPLLQLLNTNPGFILFQRTRPIFYFLFLGLSAGLFEELGRYIVMRLLMKKHHALPDGIAFGIGHGGLEAMLIGINSVYLLVTGLGLLGLGFAEVSMAGVERLLTLCFHMGASVMVMQAVVQKKPLWLAFAILLHTAVDTGIGILQYAGVSAWIIEGYIAIFSVSMLLYTIALWRMWKSMYAISPPAPPSGSPTP
ncbi:YhfC family intramembrane metalloprotease [Ruminococcaceae bacterium OttesenSCG-928-I18]|nr:YhfC family intramembrane metalloprotease [Ruminococcaceae bacterium OttesenSCG-928-I18]